jgi:hypothetical protein
MTEQSIGSSGEDQELTNQTSNSRLNKEGDIFMADSTSNSETGSGQGESDSSDNDNSGLTPEEKAQFDQENRDQFLRRSSREQQQDEEKTWRTATEDAKASTQDKSDEGQRKAVDEMFIKALRGEYPSGEPLSKIAIKIMVEEEAYKALEFFVSKIISVSLSSETTPFSEGFYGPINMNVVREALRERTFELKEKLAEIGDDLGAKEAMQKRIARMDAQFQRLDWLYKGSQMVHNLNMAIITGQTKHFVEQAQGINSEYVQTLLQVKAVAQVMRLYEQEMLRVRTRDGMMTAKNFAEITGSIFDDKGAIVGRTEGTIEKKLAIINQSLDPKDRLDEWQLKWAFYTGRNLLNVTVRTGELVAQGNTPTSRAFPLESAAGLIDKINLTTERFHIGKVRGGIHYVKIAKQVFEEDRARRGYQESNIETMLGRSRKEFEATGILDVTGMFNTWRMTNAMFIKDPDGIGGLISLETYLNEDRFTKEGAWQKKLKTDTPDGLRKAFFATDKDGNFIDDGGSVIDKTAIENGDFSKCILKKEFSYSLGTLLKLKDLLPDDKNVVNKGGDELLQAKREVRTKIFERIAKENPVGMAIFLRGLRFNKDSALGKKHNTSLGNLDRFMYGTDRIANAGVIAPNLQDTKEWKLLNEKLTLANEIRLRNIAKSLSGELIEGRPVSEKEMTFEHIFEKEVLSKLTSEEEKTYLRTIYKEISNIGQDISGELAEIRWPSVPILNDLLYEHYQFVEAGPEIARRRLGGDVPKFHETMEVIAGVIQNIQDIDPKKAMEEFHKAVDALAFPLGQEVSQSNIYPLVYAYFRFIQAGGEKFKDVTGKNPKNPEEKERGETTHKYESDLMTWLRRQNIYTALRKSFNEPNSIAQVYGGKKAFAYNEMDLDDLINDAVKVGTLRKGVRKSDGDWMWTDLQGELKKKFKLGWLWRIFLAGFRDLLWLYGVGMVKEFGKDTTKGIDKN